MKRFDSQAIKNRLLDRMRVKLDWALLSEDGTISAVLDTFADSQAEIARYAEYLLAEKKWTTAQNRTSLTTQVGLIGRKTKRKRSAISYVIVSHTDESGVDRLANFGKSFFNLDDRSNYDNITIDSDSTNTFHTQTLVPWTYNKPYSVPKGTQFISASGVEFISTSTVASRTLKEPWDIIVNDSSKYADFISSGGWSGIKYLKVPVIQGKIKTYTLSSSAQGARFESFNLPIGSCEDASNNISQNYLKLLVNPTPGNSINEEEWVQVRSLLLAGPYDRVYEVTNQPDYSGVIFKVGDGINGKRLPEGAEVTVQYLETAGSSGNIDKKYQVTTIKFPEGSSMIDPRTGAESNFLSVTNPAAILGGEDEEDEDDLRELAPLDYLKYYAIATTDAYETQIKRYSQVGLDKVKVFGGFEQSALTPTFELDETGKAVSIPTAQPVLYVTAISSNGSAVEDAETSLVEAVSLAIGDLKGPSDTLTYIAPNMIKLRLNASVYTDDSSISDEEIIALETQSLKDNYSVFNTDFKKPFHTSEFISLAKAFPFVSYVDTFIEAIAEVEFTTDNVIQIPETTVAVETTEGVKDVTYETLYKFNFKFDSIYGQNPYLLGFRNYRQSASYLLKIELNFINDPAKAAKKNRTFFLYDNRYLWDAGTLPSLEEGKYLDITGTEIVTNQAALSDWTRAEETLEDFQNRVVRVAQYPAVSKITDDTSMSAQIKVFDKTPAEIRPYIVDDEGNNKVYRVDEVTWSPGTTDPRVILPGGVQCYQKDSRYINYADVSFSEEYDNPDSADFATGSLVLPASYFEFSGIDTEQVDQFIGALKNFVSIKVYARPLLTDITPTNWNDIVFVEDEDISVECNRIVD